MTTPDEKYIVFKREEFFQGMGGLCNGEPINPPDVVAVVTKLELPDATVIRSQDVFAGPALHAYASSISTALEILEAEDVVLGGDVVSRMEVSRDYFFQRALEADDVRTKKVPD